MASRIDLSKIEILKSVGKKLGQPNYLAQMLQNFYADGQKNLSELAAVQGDTERFDFAADTIHRFNGSCGFFGATYLQKQCKMLEKQLREQTVDPDSTDFQRQVQALVKELDQFYVQVSSTIDPEK